ncbi:MAG: hypothetical protein ABWY34_04270 [Pseudoxanthomonas sp.]
MLRMALRWRGACSVAVIHMNLAFASTTLHKHGSPARVGSVHSRPLGVRVFPVQVQSFAEYPLMDPKTFAELQLRNLSSVIPSLSQTDVPRSLLTVEKIRTAIKACHEEHQGHLLLELECLVGKLMRIGQDQ